MEYNAEDIDELITYYIRSRPELWDCKNKSYRDNELKKKLWCEMAEKLNVTGMYYLKNISIVLIITFC